MLHLYKRRSLKAKLALWSMLALVLVVAGFTTITLSIVHTDMRQGASDAQAALADSISHELDTRVGERRDALSVSAAVLGPMELTAPADLSGHFASRPVLQSMFDLVFTTDRDGVIVFDSPMLPGRTGRSIADRPYFKDLMITGKPVISQPVVGKATGEPIITFASPLRNSRGEITGALCGVLYLTRPNFLSALSNTRIGKTGYVSLLAKGDHPVIVMHAQRERIMEAVPPASVNAHVHQALRGFEGTVQAFNSKGLEALFTYRSLRNAPWVVTFAYPTAEAYAQIRGTQRQVLALAAIMLMVCGVAVWVFTERLLSPLERLRSAMVDARHHAVPVMLPVTDEAQELQDVVQAYNELMAHKNGVVAALTQTEQRLRLIADNLPAQIAQIGSDERFLFANALVSRGLGVSPDAVVGRTVQDVRGDALYATLAPYLKRAFQGERVRFEGDTQLRSQHFYFETHYIPEFGDDGKVRGLFAMTFDITQRKHAELQQARSEARVVGILTHAADAFISIDAHGKITEWNRQAELTFGWPRDEVMGRELAQVIIPEEMRSSHNAGMARFMRSGTGPVINNRIEVTALRRDGARIPVELSVQAVQDGDFFAANAFLRDISERKKAEASLAASENRLRDVTNTVPALIGYFDRDERCEFSNAPGARFLGFEHKDMKGKSLREVLGEQPYLDHRIHLQKAQAGKTCTFEGALMRRGEKVNFQGHIVPDFGADGEVRGIYLMTFDITPIKHAERLHAEGEQRLRMIADNLPVLISYIDEHERLQFANETFRSWLGLDPHAALGKTVEEIVGAALYEQRRDALKRALKGERVTFDLESTSLGIHRHLHNEYVPDIRADGVVAGVYALSSDVTPLKLVEKQLSELARIDVLTALPNRRAFDERLRDALLRSRRTGRPMALMFLDIDHFKQINDTHGHGVGDQVLKEFAKRLHSCVRLTDTVARLAGDEFVIILEGLNTVEEVAVIARKIGGALRVPLLVADLLLLVTSSIGISYVDGEEVTPADVVAKADSALYDAKRAGRNTFATAAW
ncbi:MAG: hypothetical protein RLZZ618_3773 [Pseudomonadota bacterium]